MNENLRAFFRKPIKQTGYFEGCIVATFSFDYDIGINKYARL